MSASPTKVPIATHTDLADSALEAQAGARQCTVGCCGSLPVTSKTIDRYFDLDGLRFHCRDWGGTGRPIVLLHGLASNCHIWDLVAPLLAKRFAVVALDQRSHGESAGNDDGYDFATIAGDLRSFLEAHGLARPILVGHSWGGNVALELAASQPDVVTGLVFVDGGFFDTRSRRGATWEKVERTMAPPDLTHLTMEEMVARAREVRWGDMWRPEVEAVLRASFEEQPDGTIRPRLRRQRHMAIVRAMWEQRPAKLYPKVRAPVLIMPARRQGAERSGSMDLAAKKKTVARAEALLPRARTVWLEDSIHDVPLQRPETVADVILQAEEDGFFDA